MTIPESGTSKLPFDIDEVVRRIRKAVEPLPKAALFQLAEEGFNTPFEQLVACIISIRTKDEVTLPVSRRLFSRARTPGEIYKLTPQEIEAIIVLSTFYERKAVQIREIARQVQEE